MPITSLTCTSRQARTQRLHWMHASRLTRIAGWLASGGQRRRRESGLVNAIALRPAPEFRLRIVRMRRAAADRRRAVPSPFAAPRSRARSRLNLHPWRRRAFARGREHALAVDLHHADAAIAVGPIAGRGRVAEVRDRRCPSRLGDLPDRFAGRGLGVRPSSSKVIGSRIVSSPSRERSLQRRRLSNAPEAREPPPIQSRLDDRNI